MYESSNKFYIFWFCRRRRKLTTELVRCFDRRTKYESETTFVWLFLSCYVSISSFLLVSYIYLGISLEKSVLSLGSFFIFFHKLIKRPGCVIIRLSWRMLWCAFKKKKNYLQGRDRSIYFHEIILNFHIKFTRGYMELVSKKF